MKRNFVGRALGLRKWRQKVRIRCANRRASPDEQGVNAKHGIEVQLGRMRKVVLRRHQFRMGDEQPAGQPNGRKDRFLEVFLGDQVIVILAEERPGHDKRGMVAVTRIERVTRGL